MNKKLILIAVMILALIYAPKKLMIIGFLIVLAGDILWEFYILRKEKQSKHPWLVVSNYPIIIPALEIEEINDEALIKERKEFFLGEKVSAFGRYAHNMLQLGILIYVCMELIQEDLWKGMAVLICAFIILPLAKDSYMKMQMLNSRKEPFGVKGVFIGSREDVVEQNSLIKGFKISTKFECKIAEIQIGENTFDVLCDDGDLEEFKEGDMVYVFSRITNDMDELGINSKKRRDDKNDSDTECYA